MGNDPLTAERNRDADQADWTCARGRTTAEHTQSGHQGQPGHPSPNQRRMVRATWRRKFHAPIPLFQRRPIG